MRARVCVRVRVRVGRIAGFIYHDCGGSVSAWDFAVCLCCDGVVKLFVNGRERVQTDVNKLRPCVYIVLNGVSWHAKKGVIACRFG